MSTASYPDKYHDLQRLLLSYESVVVGLSGGIDSLLLCLVAHEQLAHKVCAVTVVTPLTVQSDVEEAGLFCRERGIAHRIVTVNVLNDPHVRTNEHDRCYHCKKMILTELCSVQQEIGAAIACEGSNSDDGDDYRPGMRAIRELGIQSPLLATGFTKQDIRLLAKELGIRQWQKVSETCYATRIAYNEPITPEKIGTIARAEAVIKNLGIPLVRVRCHGPTARIETDPAYMELLLQHREYVLHALKGCGFSYVTLDLAGYIRGSLNASLEAYSEKDVDE